VRAFVWAAVILLVTGRIASGQTGQDVAYSAMIETLCRQYAAALVGVAADPAFNQCMVERHCRVSAGPSGYRCEPPQPMSWHGGGY
jgi:hypothetical protein